MFDDIIERLGFGDPRRVTKTEIDLLESAVQGKRESLDVKYKNRTVVAGEHDHDWLRELDADEGYYVWCGLCASVTKENDPDFLQLWNQATFETYQVEIRLREHKSITSLFAITEDGRLFPRASRS